jgi:hypothetical protein
MTLLEKINLLILNTKSTIYNIIPVYCKFTKPKNIDKCLYSSCQNLTNHWSKYCSNECCKLDKEK